MSLPTEKEFELAAFKLQIKAMTKPQLERLAAMLYEQGLVKDVLMAELLKTQGAMLGDILEKFSANA